MRACMRFCTILAVSLIAFSGQAYGQEISWVAIGADGPFTTSMPNAVGEDTRITMDAGVLYRVEFEIRGNGWANAPGTPTLGTYQATLDRSGQLGLNAVPANAGVDLIQIGGAYGGFTGAYQQLKSCITFLNVDTGQRCDTLVPPLPACPGGTFCGENPNFVFAGILNTASVSTATANFAWGAVANSPCKTDMGAGNIYYMATYIFDVPAAAGGIYTFGFDPAEAATFLNKCDGSKITGVALTAGSVELTLVDCCLQLGGGATSCTPNVPSNQCAGQGQTAFPVGSCANPAFECPSCETPEDCADDNDCTDDICNPDKTCSNPDNYDPATECCNPAGGLTVPISDGDVCTDDSCDPLTGAVTHDPTTTAGDPCDDGFGCTHSDACDGINSQADGGCVGDDANDDDCSTEPCVVGTCNPVSLLCECSEDTPLCVIFEQDNDKLENCYSGGETIHAAVHIGGGSEIVTGGQFLLTYDPACLNFESIGPCPGSPFQTVIANNVDENAGTIFYAIIVDPMFPVGTQGPEDMVCLTFTKLADCDECEVCFASVNPLNTILTNDKGNAVPLDSCVCSKTIKTAGEITMSVPPGEAVNADCDLPTAVVEWNAPSASDTCDGALVLDCVAENDAGVLIDHLILGGGEFPQGLSYFLCEAENSCGNVVRKVWTVDLSDKQSLDVYVQLEPVMTPGLFSRCITFELFEDCVSQPTEAREVLWFDGPYNFDGKARMKFKIDKGQYHCITARDQLHTLRSSAPIDCVDGQYLAEFRGDPLLGGNWLVGGNLDGWKKDDPTASHNTIDILDFGQFMGCIANGAVYFDGNTDCDTLGPHCDINADGDVTNVDYAFILDNYLDASKDACEGCPLPRAVYVPVESITVKELRATGRADLAVGDLNRDGVLDGADMDAYAQGVQPARAGNVRDTKVGSVQGR